MWYCKNMFTVYNLLPITCQLVHVKLKKVSRFVYHVSDQSLIFLCCDTFFVPLSG